MNSKLNKVSNPASILTKEQFRALNKVSDHKALVHLFIRVLLNVFLIYLMLFMSAKSFEFGLTVAYFIYATQIHFWGYAGIGHELLHRRVFSSKFLNDILYQFCSSLTWNNAAMFRDTHMLHHRQPLSEDDIEAQSVRNWSLLYVLQYAFIDVRALFRRLFYVTINALGVYPNFTPLSPDYVRSARITLAINLVLYLALYFLAQDLLVTSLMAVAPFSCSLLNKILAKAQHHDLLVLKDEGALKFSRTLVLPKILSFLYANMNYHAEHHFAPSVPYYNLPKMHSLLEAKGHVSSQSFFSFFNKEFRSVWLKH